MLTRSRSGISPTAAAVAVIVVIVLGGAAYWFYLAPSGTGISTSTTTTPPESTMIVMPLGVHNQSSGLDFSPVNVTVVIGVNNTVTWTNQDSTYHTVVSEAIPSGAQAFSSSPLSAGQTFTVTLTVPGTYQYECSLHPAWMQATIVVEQ